jgi:hypothetical protein
MERTAIALKGIEGKRLTYRLRVFLGDAHAMAGVAAIKAMASEIAVLMIHSPLEGRAPRQKI